MRLVIARCSVDYVGRLTAHLPMATRLILLKADGSVSVHADGGAYKPLNWMVPPCTVRESDGVWRVEHGKTGDALVITIDEIISDETYDLGVDPGLQKDGVEAHLQVLLAEQVEVLGVGWSLVRREYPTAIGPVDLLVRDERRRVGRGGDQAARRDRRRRAAHPLSRAAQPRPAASPRCAGSSPPSRSSRRRACSPSIAASSA